MSPRSTRVSLLSQFRPAAASSMEPVSILGQWTAKLHRHHRGPGQPSEASIRDRKQMRKCPYFNRLEGSNQYVVDTNSAADWSVVAGKRASINCLRGREVHEDRTKIRDRGGSETVRWPEVIRLAGRRPHTYPSGSCDERAMQPAKRGQRSRGSASRATCRIRACQFL